MSSRVARIGREEPCELKTETDYAPPQSCPLCLFSPGARIGLARLSPASGGIRIRGQILEQFKELRRLAYKEPHGRQEVAHAHGNPLGLGRTNDRNDREIAAEGWPGLR